LRWELIVDCCKGVCWFIFKSFFDFTNNSFKSHFGDLAGDLLLTLGDFCSGFWLGDLLTSTLNCCFLATGELAVDLELVSADSLGDLADGSTLGDCWPALFAERGDGLSVACFFSAMKFVSIIMTPNSLLFLFEPDGEAVDAFGFEICLQLFKQTGFRSCRA